MTSPDYKAQLLAWCEQVAVDVMTATPMDRRIARLVGRFLDAAGMTAVLHTPTSTGLSTSAVALRLYEWLETGAPIEHTDCARCEHDWEDHEPPELTAVPQEHLEEAVAAHPELDYACRVPGCGCRKFLTYTPDAIWELVMESKNN